MKYLVTGSAGFIGINLVNYLRKMNEDVVELDYPQDARTVCIDDGFDVIVHLAAETDVRWSLEHPRKCILDNCESTINLLMQANNAKFIFASSCGAMNSTNPYSASKAACEAICLAFENSFDRQISILRFSNVYGPHSRHKESVIAKFIKQKLAGEKVTIYGDGQQLRDFIYVDDVCEAIHEAPIELHHVSTGYVTSIDQVRQMLNIPDEDVIYESEIQGEIKFPEVHGSKWFDVRLKDGLEKTLQWFQDN